MEKARATAVVGLGSRGLVVLLSFIAEEWARRAVAGLTGHSGDFPTCWRALAASLVLSSIVIIRSQPRGPRVDVTLGKMRCDISSIGYTRR
ncbi:uncharacterized protein BO95DRAFT_84678 [Aspergillus brunneoviolaceus CBS 621.78]|uniref:Uncharacterized protein n=1 Tax=Aspergillus brunneoviolaceus CBS 621.78 TaxID=1450534 RepID=A0ACD1GEB0_9EURO|nr:hypothetical protein BO95DRAFT_84678 [Aspergillus brunneoviolaceus CBS 621.78]RAH47449.1 hypothetical protein BO95DRAFT_84678 [Aspergillus brunneoviolaceus CBS 621.78]